MPLGTGTFLPSAKYVLPRAYFRGIAFRFDPGAIVNAHVGYWDGYSSAAMTLYFRVTMRSTIYPWSNNRYTLDNVIVDNYTRSPPTTGPLLPFNFQLTTVWRPNFGWYIRFAPGGLGSVMHWFDLPPAPSDYWKPSL